LGVGGEQKAGLQIRSNLHRFSNITAYRTLTNVCQNLMKFSAKFVDIGHNFVEKNCDIRFCENFNLGAVQKFVNHADIENVLQNDCLLAKSGFNTAENGVASGKLENRDRALQKLLQRLSSLQ